MIDKADVCIFYYNENYQPPLKPATKKRIFSYQPKSGTKIAYDYAVQKKTIINLCSVHKIKNSMSLMQEIRQFAADVALNLSGPYLLHIAQMNGLTN